MTEIKPLPIGRLLLTIQRAINAKLTEEATELIITLIDTINTNEEKYNKLLDSKNEEILQLIRIVNNQEIKMDLLYSKLKDVTEKVYNTGQISDSEAEFRMA